MRHALRLIVVFLSVSLLPGSDAGMVRLSGTPSEIGNRWGELNRRAIGHDAVEFKRGLGPILVWPLFRRSGGGLGNLHRPKAPVSVS
jgi:hypothetical protein